MPRKLLIALLAFGTVAGFGSGFAHLSWRLHHKRWHHGHHASAAQVSVHTAPQDEPGLHGCGQ